MLCQGAILNRYNISSMYSACSEATVASQISSFSSSSCASAVTTKASVRCPQFLVTFQGSSAQGCPLEENGLSPPDRSSTALSVGLSKVLLLRNATPITCFARLI